VGYNGVTAAQFAACLSNAHGVTSAHKLDLGIWQKAERLAKLDGNCDLAFGTNPHVRLIPTNTIPTKYIPTSLASAAASAARLSSWNPCAPGAERSNMCRFVMDDYDADKIADALLARLHLTTFEDRGVVRAWKGRD
jgi:hypothetical protein